jgi:hypothetical protein
MSADELECARIAMGFLRASNELLSARVAKLEAALEKAQFALLYGDKEEFSEALDAIDTALKDESATYGNQ